MTLIVHTARINTRDPDAFNITRGSGKGDGLVFAPSEAILRPALALLRVGEALAEASVAREGTDGSPEAMKAAVVITAETWRLYSAAFTREMKSSYREHRDAWDRLLEKERCVLTCYCVSAELCHRTLVARMLAKLGAMNMGEL